MNGYLQSIIRHTQQDLLTPVDGLGVYPAVHYKGSAIPQQLVVEDRNIRLRQKFLVRISPLHLLVELVIIIPLPFCYPKHFVVKAKMSVEIGIVPGEGEGAIKQRGDSRHLPIHRPASAHVVEYRVRQQDFLRPPGDRECVAAAPADGGVGNFIGNLVGHQIEKHHDVEHQDHQGKGHHRQQGFALGFP